MIYLSSIKVVLFICSLSIMIVFFSCNDQQTSSPPASRDDSFNREFAKYLKENLGMSISDLKGDTVFVVPLRSCHPCVERTLTELRNTKFLTSGSLLFVEKPVDSLQLATVEFLKHKFKTYDDSLSKIFNYEIEMGGPTILFKKENNIIRYTPLTSENWDEAKKSILKWKN